MQQDILRALAEVPETKLGIFELLRQCTGTDGRFDISLTLPMAAEISDAQEEVQWYLRETQKVRHALHALMNGR